MPSCCTTSTHAARAGVATPGKPFRVTPLRMGRRPLLRPAVRRCSWPPYPLLSGRGAYSSPWYACGPLSPAVYAGFGAHDAHTASSAAAPAGALRRRGGPPGLPGDTWGRIMVNITAERLRHVPAIRVVPFRRLGSRPGVFHQRLRALLHQRRPTPVQRRARHRLRCRWQTLPGAVTPSARAGAQLPGQPVRGAAHRPKALRCNAGAGFSGACLGGRRPCGWRAGGRRVQSSGKAAGHVGKPTRAGSAVSGKERSCLQSLSRPPSA